MKRTIFAFCFISLLASNNIFAQGGSNYSVFGIGDLYESNASYQAMGGTSIAVPSNHAINIKNPALWGTATTTRLMTGYNFNQHLNETNNNALYQNNGQISGIYSIYSIDTSLGISASFGIHSYSNMNYLISNNFSIEKDGLTQTGKNTFQGSGGLSSAYIGASTKIVDGLLVGGSVFALFGPLRTTALTQFDDSYSYNYQRSLSDYITGWGSRLGLYYTIQNFGIGAYYESIGKVDIDRELTYSSSVLADTTRKSSFPEKLPSSFGLGLSYLSGKFLLAADLAMTQSSSLEYNPGANTEFQDAMRLSFGINRIGNPSRASDYMDRVSYKAGLSYQDMYYKIKGTKINELAFSIGAELPVGNGGIIDAAFVFGTRGIDSQDLIKEYFGKMYVEISIGELWFKPFKKRY